MTPEAQTVLDELAALKPVPDPAAGDAGWLADFRAQTAALARLGGDPEAILEVRHVIVERRDEPLLLRIYKARQGSLPVLLHLRGGGGIAGSLDGHDVALRALAKATNWAVVAPDYRMAPKACFPAQLEDAETALDWVIDSGPADDLDLGRIVVSGDSVGGALAAALAVRARDRGRRLAGQILLYPNTDLRRDATYPSRDAEDGHVISKPDLERQIDLYLASPADRLNPEASPILQPDLVGLAPALVLTCGADPLRDEGEAYGARLGAAGVVVHHVRLDHGLHGALQMGGRLNETATLLSSVSEWLDRRSPVPR